MTPDSNLHPHDDLAVYALDALDPDERERVEAHLAGCPACQAELDRHIETLAQLSVAEAPPPQVWDRISQGIASSAAPGPRLVPPGPGFEPEFPPQPEFGQQSEFPQQPGFGPQSEFPQQPEFGSQAEFPPLDPGDPTVIPFGTHGDLPRHTRPRRPAGQVGWLTGLAAAAAAVAVLVAGVAAFSGGDGADSVGDLAAAAVDDDASTVVQLADTEGVAQARVVIAEDGAGYVLFDDLPRLADGRTYQLWKIDDTTTPISLGVLGDGSAEAVAVALPAGVTSFAVTDEPGEGVPAPTGPVVAQGIAA